MKQKKLGLELEVSALGLGCMGMSEFYGSSDETACVKTIQTAYDLGITFFDTADIYGFGENEILVGKATRQFRNDIIIATKCGIVRDKNNPSVRGINNTPEYIKSCCDASLKRLGIDTIDLYYFHRIDPNVPVEESVGALKDLIQVGKVRTIGLSEASATTIRRSHAVHPITAIQTEYSLLTRNPETNNVLATCRELNIGFVPYSPLSRALLSGTVQSIAQFEESDYRKILPRFQKDNIEANSHIIEAVAKLAKEKNCTTAQLALAWVNAQGDDIVPIPGTKRVSFLKENINSLDVKLSKDDLKRLDEISPLNVAKGERYHPDMMKQYDFGD